MSEHAAARPQSQKWAAKDHPRYEWLRLQREEGLSPEDAATLLNTAVARLSGSALLSWARSLEPMRTDMEKAAQSLGRLRHLDPSLKTDLRRANLQGFSLRGLDFTDAEMSGACMEGADLRKAKMAGADLSWVKMAGADLRRADMAGTDLRGAEMAGADLSWAEMVGADLSAATMDGATLRGAKMAGADLRAAEMDGAVLSAADVAGADLSAANMAGVDLRGAKMAGAGFSEAKMTGADLRRAKMAGADLRGATLQSANLAFWSCVRANARSADFTEARNMTQEQVNSLFGDHDTKLPDTDADGALLQRPPQFDNEPLEYTWDPDPAYEVWLKSLAP